MRRLLITGLFLALAGCISGGELFPQSEPVRPEPPTSQEVVPDVAPSQPLSPAARTAVPSGENVNSGKLLDCVTESCKVNCSLKVKKQFQPKWCARFKEPAE